MALAKIKKPPAIKPYKPPRLVNIKPKLPAAGHYGPSIYNPSGRNQAYRPPVAMNTGGNSSINPATGLPWGYVGAGPGGSYVSPGYGTTTQSGGSSSSSGGGDDYGPSGGAGIIGGDWEVQAAEAAMAAGMARKRGDFQAGLRQALIDLGIGDTTKLGNLSQYIDEDTIKAAVANKYSQNAQIGAQAQKMTAQTRARNAAMGRLSSGETTNRETEIAGLAESNRFSALRDFLSGGAQGLSGLADAESSYAENIAMARAAAAQRAAETYPGAFAGGPSNIVSRNESGYYDTSAVRGRAIGNQGPAPTSAQLAGTSNPALTQRQFMAKNPRGNYYNYLRAWHRHAGLPWG